jgi:hypothetical protein
MPTISSDEAIVGDRFEVRGPITAPFPWSVDMASRLDAVVLERRRG